MGGSPRRRLKCIHFFPSPQLSEDFLSSPEARLQSDRDSGGVRLAPEPPDGLVGSLTDDVSGDVLHALSSHSAWVGALTDFQFSADGVQIGLFDFDLSDPALDDLLFSEDAVDASVDPDSSDFSYQVAITDPYQVFDTLDSVNFECLEVVAPSTTDNSG